MGLMDLLRASVSAASPDRPAANGHCARAKTPLASCRDCVDVCPPGAIRTNRRGQIEIGSSCDGCGVCVAVCHRDGLSDPRERETRWRRLVSQRVRKGLPTIVFGCSQASRPGAETVPCIASLAPWFLVEASSRVEIVLESGACASCSRGEAMRRWDVALAAALEVSPLQPGSSFGIRHRKIEGTLEAPPLPSNAPTRRDLLSFFRPQREDPEAEGEGGARRSRLASWLRRSTTTGISSDESTFPFGRISIDEKCTGCPVCVSVCPEAAIDRREESAAIVLEFSPDRCSACGACADACREGAIRLERRFDSEHDSVSSKLARIPIGSCERCGAAVSRSPICAACEREPFFESTPATCQGSESAMPAEPTRTGLGIRSSST